MFNLKRRQAIWFICAVLTVITFLIWHIIYDEQNKNTLTVAFLDVGQGDSIFIESPSGVQVLIDGGATSGVLRELAKVMPFYDRSIDMVMATHGDTDHIGGLADVLGRYQVSRIVRSDVVYDSPATQSLAVAIESEQTTGAIETLAMRGQVYNLGVDESGVSTELHILFPDRSLPHVENNLASIVAKLVYGDTSVMLTGDSPKAIEKYLVSMSGTSLQSDVLKLGHHGSKTSNTESFLGFVNPSIAIVSAGSNNRYGHPHQEVIDRLNRFGIDIKNTADSGTIILQSDGNEWVLQ